MTINYQPTSDAPRQLTLELNPSGVRLIFPPPPATLYLVALAVTLGLLLALTIMVAALLWLVRSAIGPTTPWFVFIPFAVVGMLLFFGLVSARDLWKKYRFCPREIVSIACDGESFIQEHVTWRRRRIRRWPLAKVTSASCRVLHFPLPRGEAASLRIGFRRRLSFIRTIRGERDIKLAREFVDHLQTMPITSRG